MFSQLLGMVGEAAMGLGQMAISTSPAGKAVFSAMAPDIGSAIGAVAGGSDSDKKKPAQQMEESLAGSIGGSLQDAAVGYAKGSLQSSPEGSLMSDIAGVSPVNTSSSAGEQAGYKAGGGVINQNKEEQAEAIQSFSSYFESNLGG